MTFEDGMGVRHRIGCQRLRMRVLRSTTCVRVNVDSEVMKTTGD